MLRISKLKWQRWKSQRSFDKRRDALQKRKAPGPEFSELDADEYYGIKDIEGAIDCVISNSLLDRARSLDVEIPLRTDPAMWTEHEDGELFWLTSKGRAQVRKAIDEEKTRRFERKTLWVTKLVLPILGGLVGILGALIGLVSALKK